MSHFIYRPSVEEIDELQWHVEEWDDADNKIERYVALTCSPSIGIAAYEAYIADNPGKRCELRHGSRVMRKHVPERFVAGGDPASWRK